MSGSDRGFSLIEALVALTMLGAGILALGVALTTTNRAARDSLEATVAEGLARQKLEELQSRAPGGLADGAEKVALDGIEYVRSWAVRRDSPRPGMSEVRVQVTWSEYVAPLTQADLTPDIQTLTDPLAATKDLLDSSGRARWRSFSGYVTHR